MRKLLLMWWFMTMLTNGQLWEGTIATQGPFATAAQCNYYRELIQMASKSSGYPVVTRCWSDGK